MAEIKLTKNELRNQQTNWLNSQKYLPTLQLKKAMLQAEVQEVRLEIAKLEKNPGRTAKGWRVLAGCLPLKQPSILCKR